MKTISFILVSILLPLLGFAQLPNGADILKKVDENMVSKNRVVESTMTIKTRRGEKVLTTKSYSQGDKQAFTEYLSPARERGTKMLKLDDQLWIYSPSSDRIIQISGHMLKQSVMGSDLSYEDMMDDRSLLEVYSAKLEGKTEIDGRACYQVALDAIVEDAAYERQIIWVDAERYVPLKQEMYAKSGELLKRVEFTKVKQIDGRWFPTAMTYKDMLKQGGGTVYVLDQIAFDQAIPDYIFSKAALKQ